MKKTLVIVVTLLISGTSGAVIDMKNSNFADSWSDIKVPGSGFELRIKRTYNSRSLFNGVFGYGWCSDYETKLEITAESGLLLTECGGGLQVNYTQSIEGSKNIESTISKIISEIKKRNKAMSAAELNKLSKDLVNDQYLRIAFVKRLSLQGKVEANKIYRANGRESEHIILKNNFYTRTLANGTMQRFNLKGQLTRVYDKNRNFVKIEYKNSKLHRIIDNSGKQLNFVYSRGSKALQQIKGPNGISATYRFNGENLAYSKNQWHTAYKYKYDKLHNLTRIIFPDGSFKKLTYNTDRDWVTQFRNRKGCVETYKYKINKKAKYDHYWSTVVKKCGNKITNKSTYEFKYKGLKGSKASFLANVNSNVNGDKTSIVYHSIFGKPTRVSRNGLITTYKYYDNGFVKRKQQPYRHYYYEYNNTCSKVSSVQTKYFGPFKKNQKKRKAVKTRLSKFYYDKAKCNLKRAKNSAGQTVQLSYDSRGRISKIIDQTKKVVAIKYESRFGKPELVQRPGLGSLKISYNSRGEIDKYDSKQGAQVAVQVASILNNLLELISPATTDLSL